MCVRSWKGGGCHIFQFIKVLCNVSRKSMIICFFPTDLDYLKMSAQEEKDDHKDQCHLSHVDQKQPECKSHKKICEMYCTDCNEPTCAMCVTGDHKKHDISHIDDIIKRFKENIIADINKHEKTLDSLHLDLDENESLRVFDSALSAIQDHEDKICNAVREISCQLKVEVEKQKKQFEGKTKITNSVKEKIGKELHEGIEKDKSILQSNDATKILNYQPRNINHDNWPKDTEASSVKFLPGQVNHKELQLMFGKIQLHDSTSEKTWYNKAFHGIHGKSSATFNINH